MKSLSRTLFLAGISLAAAVPTIAQQSASRGVPGFLNPKDGSFHVRQAAPDADVAAATTLTPYNGKLVFTFSINLITPVPSGQQVACEVTAGLDDFNSSGYTNFISEEASTVATVSGSKATCTVKIPYFWELANGPGDTVGLNYSVSIYPTSTTNITNFITRTSSQQLPSIKVPLPGVTTTKAVTVNL